MRLPNVNTRPKSGLMASPQVNWLRSKAQPNPQMVDRARLPIGSPIVLGAAHLDQKLAVLGKEHTVHPDLAALAQIADHIPVDG